MSKPTTTTIGLMGFIHGVTEDDIEKLIKRYRRKHPRDKRKDIELRPYAVNQIVAERSNSR